MSKNDYAAIACVSELQRRISELESALEALINSVESVAHDPSLQQPIDLAKAALRGE